jgi:uncharacterized protein YqeY
MLDITTITQDRVNSRSCGDTVKYNLLTTLLGDLELEFKRSGNVDVLAMIKKYIKNAEITLEVKPDHTQTKEELVILKDYLPSQLTELDIKYIISQRELSTMGEFMAFMKKYFPNRYDGKVASQIFKEWHNEQLD